MDHSLYGARLVFRLCIGQPGYDTVLSVRRKIKANEGLLFDETKFKEKVFAAHRAYALNWLMISLTRSMDHLVIHLTNADSGLGAVLQSVDRDKIRWL